MNQITDTERLDWCLKNNKMPYESPSYWGRIMWRIQGIPRINAFSFRNAIDDAIQNDSVTETRKKRRNKFSPGHYRNRNYY